MPFSVTEIFKFDGNKNTEIYNQSKSNYTTQNSNRRTKEPYVCSGLKT